MPRLRRQISFDLKPKAIDSAFPVTLHYYSPHRTSSLFDLKEKDSRPYSLQAEVVNMTKDGLVYPSVGEARRCLYACYCECTG